MKEISRKLVGKGLSIAKLMIVAILILISAVNIVELIYPENTSDIRAEYMGKKHELKEFLNIEKEVLIDEEGIKIKKFPENIEFKIHNSDEKISLQYYQDNPDVSQRKIVEITMSENYDILDKQYVNCSLETFESYKREMEYKYKFPMIFVFFIIELVLISTIVHNVKVTQEEERERKFRKNRKR